MKRGLNLGCGTRIFRSNVEIEWVNLDIQAGHGVDCVDDWRHCLRGCSYDLIVAHHTFEHVNCGMQPIMQCWEIIPPSGSLIVAVPDLRKLANLWLSGELSTQIYLTNIYGPYDGTEASIHKWGFDRDYLREALVNAIWPAKWYDIRSFDYRHIPGADIARDDRWILCLECIK